MDDTIREETIAGGMQGFDDEHHSILFGKKQYAERQRKKGAVQSID